MSLSAKKTLDPHDAPHAPHLRLQRDTVDPVEDADPALPPAPAWVLTGETLCVEPNMRLPRRCVQCGDPMDLLSVHTLRGAIRYSICREHAVLAAAKLLSGVALALLALVCVGSSVLGEPLTTTSGTVLSLFVGLTGAGLIYWSLPLRSSKLKDARHRLSAVHPDVIADLDRVSR